MHVFTGNVYNGLGGRALDIKTNAVCVWEGGNRYEREVGKVKNEGKVEKGKRGEVWLL